MASLQFRAPQNASVPRSYRYRHLFIFGILFTIPLIAVHWGLLKLPYFWDEEGQFIPASLDLFRHGDWVARSTIPNIHPPGVELYLALWYQLFGYSIAITRTAMLCLAGPGLLLIFLLTIELSRNMPGLPAFYSPLFLFASPLFYMQSMMAQLDMPAMVFTLLALLLFLREQHAKSALASVALVVAKETGAVVPLILFLVLIQRRQSRKAFPYLTALLVLFAWLIALHHATGYWMGNPDFERYNLVYSLHPVRLLVNAFRRIYYLFFAEFRWIGFVALILARKQLWAMRSSAWAVVGLVCAAHLLVVTVFGGAALERYLLPVLPFFYVLTAIAIISLPAWQRIAIAAGMTLGLFTNLFWNPPYPFPFENNYAMVDFVELQQAAANYIQDHLPGRRIATAWPYTAGLRSSDFGYVREPQQVVETKDFHVDSVRAIPPNSYDLLVIYTRTWTPERGLTNVKWIHELLTRFYELEPAIDEHQCALLGLYPVVSWQRHGQSITLYNRPSIQTQLRSHSSDKPEPRQRKQRIG